jgi:hypothetical protein
MGQAALRGAAGDPTPVVTETADVPDELPTVAVMVVEPSATPVTMPPETVATDGMDVDQTAALVRLAVVPSE